QYAIRNTIYACGPKPMLKTVAKIANKYRLACQISMEEYMGCGTGICMGCSVKTLSGNRLVCKDGPIFDAKEIVW
ncbi:MAG: dihydroorotate dehydrogenase electron transfer subunit, partial [Candidatus Omnitrophica bacterium]|nr:dihydroorotate dehydrogenase electron transfer subunit [Candidatus Omnitrophota bacterium]